MSHRALTPSEIALLRLTVPDQEITTISELRTFLNVPTPTTVAEVLMELHRYVETKREIRKEEVARRWHDYLQSVAADNPFRTKEDEADTRMIFHPHNGDGVDKDHSTFLLDGTQQYYLHLGEVNVMDLATDTSSFDEHHCLDTIAEGGRMSSIMVRFSDSRTGKIEDKAIDVHYYPGARYVSTERADRFVESTVSLIIPYKFYSGNAHIGATVHSTLDLRRGNLMSWVDYDKDQDYDTIKVISVLPELNWLPPTKK